jgi:hypothetical protein
MDVLTAHVRVVVNAARARVAFPTHSAHIVLPLPHDCDELVSAAQGLMSLCACACHGDCRTLFLIGTTPDHRVVSWQLTRDQFGPDELSEIAAFAEFQHDLQGRIARTNAASIASKSA